MPERPDPVRLTTEPVETFVTSRQNQLMGRRVPAAVVASSIAVYFFFLAGRGLLADFTFDDLGNLYFAWIRPVPELLRANLLFFLPPSRPLGMLFYALGFQFAGLNPAPYHVVCFLFLGANVYLTYCF